MTKEVKWSIDQAHSDITFKVKHLMIAHVNGSFKIFDASIYTNEKNFNTAEIDLWIDASSITTGNVTRDEHLKSVDFLNVEKYKQISFSLSSVGKSHLDGKHEVEGELTIKDVTRSVKLLVAFGGVVNDPWGNEKAGFIVSGLINRNDWGLVWNIPMETGGLLVSEEITISCELELMSAKEPALTVELESSAEKKITL